MIINKIDKEKNETTLSFNRHELLTIRRALQKVNDELSEEDKWLVLEITGVDDVLKDGNFSRFLSYHRGLVEMETKPEVEKC